MRKIIFFPAFCLLTATVLTGCTESGDVQHPIKLAMLAQEGKLPYASQESNAHSDESAGSSTNGMSAAEIERQRALAEPYPNDFGPDSLDVSAYPKDIQIGYTVFQEKCTVCHSAARPLNSEFLESSGKTSAERTASYHAMKKSHPEIFSAQNRLIWKVEANIWQRFVKRMRAKPGCDITKVEFQQIWDFLAYDSRKRKSGPNTAQWAAHRKKLVSDFKKKYPKRYKILFQ